jgi:GTP-binding protein EngB required for normal cell division
MDDLLKIIKACSEDLNILSLKENAERLEKFIECRNIIDIVILGQFKAGKSSFINHFIGKEILPTGVTPVTSVVTRLQYGETEKAIVTFFNNTNITVPVNSIDKFISEDKNPENVKSVAVIDIELPCLNKFKGIRFVDTPGIGSVFQHNTETTENWFTEIGIAFVTISAERPLGENEMILIREISKHTPEAVILLTKVDLFNDAQIKEIRNYILKQLQKEFNREFRIFNYSIFDKAAAYKQLISDEAINPVLSGLTVKQEEIIKHKINSLANTCLNYLQIAYASSLKSDEEKEQLKQNIFSEKINTAFIRQELQLITDSSKAHNRDIIYNIIEKYKTNLVTELQSLFNAEYPSWKGNLYKVSRKYEEWMKASLSGKLKEVYINEQIEFINILNTINEHFTFFTKSFRAKLSENIYKVLGIKLNEEEWKPQFKPLKQPDISVYRAFDFPIDLLWFLFPMFIFRKVFSKYFLKQIPNEVEKNIHRLTSDINEIINKETEYSKEQTLKYILDELNSVEKVLSGEHSRSCEYRSIADSLQEKIKDLQCFGLK